MAVHPWNADVDGELNVDAVRLRHQPASHYRISPNNYLAGTSLPGISRVCWRYVLTGACTFSIDDQLWHLVAPCYVELPAGNYEFAVVGPDDVSMVSVWSLPRAFSKTD